MISIETVETEAGKVNTSATEKQLEAGNYSKGHISVKGMKIAIESPIGSRRYYDNGTKYNVMKNHYGYFNITKGKDGDAVDVFLGPDIEDFDRVYCIDQNKANGEFDETKVMLGFSSKEEAKEAYMSNYSPDWKGFRDITSVSVKDFKKWLYRGRKQRQPFADYVYIKKKKIDEMKKVINLNESDLTGIIMNSVKRALKEGVDEWGDDPADMMGMYDGYMDGPTNDGPYWDELVYDKALSIMKMFEFEGDEAAEAVESILKTAQQDRELMSMEPDEAAKVVAKKAMKSIDPDYFESDVEPMMEGRRTFKLSEGDLHSIIKATVKRVLKENKLTRDNDFEYPEKPDDEYLDSQYEKWKSENGPTQEDWDDFGSWASSDEPDLVNDEIGAEHDRNEMLLDADDEGSGSSVEYMKGVKYAKNLIAKSRIPDDLVEKLASKEDNGTITQFELGILDTLNDF